jgi:hypothetical protein
LRRLTAEDVQELEVALIGDRRRAFNAITALGGVSSGRKRRQRRAPPPIRQPSCPASTMLSDCEKVSMDHAALFANDAAERLTPASRE